MSKFFVSISFFLLFSFKASLASEYVFPSQMEEDNYTNTDELKDPYEKLNRKIFKFNHYVEKAVLKPVTLIYTKLTPKWGQTAINNFLDNLSTPLSMINAALVFDINEVGKNFWKFTINTTFGLGGLYNFSDKALISAKNYDFSTTLKHYKISSGPYIILPLLGPSSFRETVGLLINIPLDPINHIFNNNFQKARTGLTILNSYNNKLNYVSRIENNSLDPYATIRSLYIQNKIHKEKR